MILDGTAENVGVLPPALGHIVQPLEELDGDLLHLLLPLLIQNIVDIPAIEPREDEKGDAYQQQKRGQRKCQRAKPAALCVYTIVLHPVLLPEDIVP